MKKSNITDFENYKYNMMSDMSGIENIDDDMINAYLQAVDIDTPDMWERIEAGFEEEVRRSGVTQVTESVYVTNNKIKNRKIFGFVAAGVLITVIALPLIMHGVIGKKGEMMEDMEAPTDLVEENQASLTESEASDSAVAETGSNDEGVSSENTGNKTDEIVDERTLVIQGEIIKLDKNIVGYGIIVEEVITNEYEEFSFQIGEVVIISNTLALENISDTVKICQVQLEDVYINEYGKRQGKMTDIEIIEYGFD